MEQITFCESCRAEILAIAAYCVKCGNHRVPTRAIPLSPPPMPVQAPEPIESGGFIDCPECAEPIREQARSCRFCGYDLVRRTRHGAGARPGRSAAPAVVHVHHSAPRSPGVAAVLAFFFPGVGHIYAGRIGRGFGFMFAPLVVLVIVLSGAAASSRVDGSISDKKLAGWALILFLFSGLVYVWQILDAYACAQPERPYRRRRRR
ncbi:MAG: TM2 domain-containing protein [Planctomycetes bacterium]|nr:TM2 domain-containing protein [Planctomycetota bacterium]